ncbi:MAG: right-handed parallel beta-helix repeat-containing protein, partial [Verrucomicrobiales bacterium]|nr:right-handed parallel beta-helix repeat-containing protein [Verrucomicrobiales bacterium]
AASLTAVLANSVRLALGMTAGPSPRTLGSPVFHHLTVTNAGPDTARSVVLAVRFEAGATVQDASASAGSVSTSPGELQVSFGSMAPGAIETLTFALFLSGSAPSATEASVSASEVDVDPSDNAARRILETRLPTRTVTTLADAGPGSLRQALLDANASPDTDVIAFRIPTAGETPVILLAADLPTLVHPVVLDGLTQPGGRVQVDGGGNRLLLDVEGGDSTLRGLALVRSAVFGLTLQRVGRNVVEACSIGIAADGITAASNRGSGLSLSESSNENRIGGPEPWQRNVIGTNGSFGIVIERSHCNLVQGNSIGVAADGTTPRGNTGSGVAILESYGNRILDNLISGNGEFTAEGILLGILSGDALIQGNRIGTDISGTFAIPNLDDGIAVGSSSKSVLIGGPLPLQRNLVSGNRGSGIRTLGEAVRIVGNYIGTDARGTTRLPNRDNGVELAGALPAVVGGPRTGEGNLISGNHRAGITITTHGHRVAGNIIGLDAAGSLVLSNGAGGITLTAARGNDIGGTTPEERNVISGNLGSGISLALGASLNRVRGNFIGTDASGTLARSNSLSGISLANTSSDNTLGGLAVGEGNLISGNGFDGVTASGSAARNRILGNILGADVGGSSGLGNRLGISLFQNATATHVEGNQISGNRGSGIQLTQTNAPGATVTANLIETDASGTNALPNGGDGILVFHSPANTLGPDNLIGGNAGSGIDISRTNAFGNIVAGNVIGLGSDLATVVPNNRNGVTVFDASLNRIGGTAPSDANTIGRNLGHGVQIFADAARPESSPVGNSILGNLFLPGGGRDIDLGGAAEGTGDGATPNDPLDADVGPNLFQNHPILDSATPTRVSGALDAAPSTQHRVEFFARPPTPTLDPLPVFLGAAVVTTDSLGHADLSLAVSGLPVGRLVSATATDALGNTSEFSPELPVTDPSTVDSDGDGIPDEQERIQGSDPLDRLDPALPPVARDDNVRRTPNRSLKIALADLLANDSDPNGTTPAFLEFDPTSANGIPLRLLNGFITFDPGSGNNATDSFRYRITDGSLTASAVVTLSVEDTSGATFNLAIRVEGSVLTLRVVGIPGRTYQVQSTPSLAEPIVWSDVGGPVVADGSGSAVRTDTVASPRFYRAIEP